MTFELAAVLLILLAIAVAGIHTHIYDLRPGVPHAGAGSPDRNRTSPPPGDPGVLTGRGRAGTVPGTPHAPHGVPSADGPRPLDQRRPEDVPLGGLQLTDAALEAIGVQPSRPVPLLALPWRDDARDRKPS